jgi:multicomponent Na+:H+ antiporter subunit D
MNGLMPVMVLLTSLVPALVIFFLEERQQGLRTAINLAGAVAKLALVAVLLEGVARGVDYEARFTLLPGLELLLRVDALSLLFLTLSAFLWLVTTIYAISYLGTGPHLSRFFGFFSLCVAATTGIALSGSLITFFIFYELLTLSTWPLVIHHGDRIVNSRRPPLSCLYGGGRRRAAGRNRMVGKSGRTDRLCRPRPPRGIDTATLEVIFWLLIGGLGVKAAIVPLHSWLPAAMVAPTPVSALLHAVAVVKAGAFGIIRVIYDVYGIAFVHELGMGVSLAAIASFTIIYGSVRALQQDNIKRRLAFSTVSQVSYIVLGTCLIGPLAVVGGLAHLVHQGLMKITLFFCAGALAKRRNIYNVDDLNGIGRAMPWTAAAFSVGALGMIGVPPIAGFISKWYLGIGGIQGGQAWVVLVIAGSSLLNAIYFLPLIYRAWFMPGPDTYAPGDEGPLWLIAPAVLTAFAAIAVGVFAGLAYSPLGWATLIVQRVYAP